MIIDSVTTYKFSDLLHYINIYDYLLLLLLVPLQLWNVVQILLIMISDSVAILLQ